MSKTFEERMAREDAYDRGYDAGYYVGKKDGHKEAINDIPPVKHGWWDGYICSECNECADYFISGDFYFDEKPNFCPNCGADMRKGM